jgi:membrane protein DedA with SNARE-associated domain
MFRLMDWHYLIQTHGYWVLALAVMAEGETVLVLAGLAAQQGYLKLHWVILIAAICTICVDQTFFYLGRLKGKAFLNRWPKGKQKSRRVLELMIRHRYGLALGFRFLYGLRTITPFIIGMSPIGRLQFLCLNMLSGAVWATAVAMLGFALGSAAEGLLGKIKGLEVILAGGIALAALAIWCIHRLRERRKERSGQGGGVGRDGVQGT